MKFKTKFRIKFHARKHYAPLCAQAKVEVVKIHLASIVFFLPKDKTK